MKFILLLCCVILSQLAFSQKAEDVNNQVNSSIRSEIIDHSDVQQYITNHELVVKKKDFINGYRIQIFTSPDRDNAQKVKSDFYSKFSNVRCYLTYQQPYYRIRVGNYDTPQSAQPDLKRMAKYYPSSFLVPDIITTSNKDKEEDQ